MPLLFWDAETRSTIPLDKAGAWRYAGNSTTEVLCVAHARDDGEPQIWTSGQPIPPDFIAAAGDPNFWVVAHNDQFERALETRLLHPRYGWPLIPLAQRRCTLAASLANALPGALEKVTEALALPGKDPKGRQVMRKMAQPRRARKDEDPGGRYWVDGPELRDQLHRYCLRDVEIERALFHRLLPLSPAEQKLWELDAAVNDRGFFADIPLAKAARDIALAEKLAIDAEISTLTGGEITSVDQTAKIQAFVRRHGHAITSLTKRSVAAVLARRPGDAVRRLLELRREGARASVRKLDSLLAGIDDDSRLRGTLRYCGSSTGRWSGSRFQPQNLKKPELPDTDAAVVAARPSGCPPPVPPRRPRSALPC